MFTPYNNVPPVVPATLVILLAPLFAVIVHEPVEYAAMMYDFPDSTVTVAVALGLKLAPIS